MSELLTFPLNNIEYDASDFETYLATRTSGVFRSNSFQYSVSGADTNITIGTGLAWIHNHEFAGKVFRNGEALTVNCGNADTNLPRYDVIAIQYDKAGNVTNIVCKHGTPASSPQYPAITQTVSVYELYLYAIYRPAGATYVTEANITDLRMNATYCGYMADSVTSIDMSAVLRQCTDIISQIQALLVSVESQSGVMLKQNYDSDNDGIVDNAEALEGHPRSDFVPVTRTVAGKALSSDITLAKGDVGLGKVNNTGISFSLSGTVLTITVTT